VTNTVFEYDSRQLGFPHAKVNPGESLLKTLNMVSSARIPQRGCNRIDQPAGLCHPDHLTERRFYPMDVLHGRYTKHQIKTFALEVTLFNGAHFINDRWVLKGVANVSRYVQATDNRTSFDEGYAVCTGATPDYEH